MSSDKVKVGIVGLGRWAKVLARAAAKSDKLRIVAGYSRSQEKRTAFAREFGVAVGARLGDACWRTRDIAGVILTVPNEQHLPLAIEVAKAGKHVYTEKPIASTLEEGLEIARAAGELRRHGHGRPQRAPDGRHPADPRGDRRAASSAASPSSRRISPTSGRSS